MGRLTPLSKIMILVVVVGGLIGGWRMYQQHASSATGGAPAGSSGSPFTAQVSDDAAKQTPLGRPLRIGLVTWPGYIGGPMENNGFKPNPDSAYFKDHKLLCDFELVEDADIRAKALQNGSVDIVWSTVDFLANESPGFLKNGAGVKAIMQVDWSRGADAIVVGPGVKKIEDLAGKRISLAQFTPSHWFLESMIENSSMDENTQSQLMKNAVFVNSSPDARTNFVAKKVDAAVMWEPDVATALKARPDAHVLIDSSSAANLIADVMICRADFAESHPDVVKAFVAGWLDGVTAANRDSTKAAEILMAGEPTYQALGEDETKRNLGKVKWADLGDNAKMFGLDGSPPLFDAIFKKASAAWVKRGYITVPLDPSQVKDTRALKEIYRSMPASARPMTPREEFHLPKATRAKSTQTPVATKKLRLQFASNSAALSGDSKAQLDSVSTTIREFSNAYIRIEGNSANTGHAAGERQLSLTRARSAAAYLEHRYGFNPSRFIVRGLGSDHAHGFDQAVDRHTDIAIVPR